MDTVEKLAVGLYQIAPTERCDSGEEEMILCGSVVEGRETVPLFLASTAGETVTIKL